MKRMEGAENRKSTVLDLCYIAVFTALIAIMAQISIPLPGGVPLTLQTLAVPLAGIVLGARRGTISTLLYVLLAAVGVPVLAGLTGGIGYVFGMTGGFIMSFPLMALAAGLGAWFFFKGREETESGSHRALRYGALWGGLIVGAAVNYLVGTIWFMVVAEASLGAALAACVLPFIPTAIVKIILAGMLGPILRHALVRAGLLQVSGT